MSVTDVYDDAHYIIPKVLDEPLEAMPCMTPAPSRHYTFPAVLLGCVGELFDYGRRHALTSVTHTLWTLVRRMLICIPSLPIPWPG
jgi:hypothetical protein